MVKSCQNHVHDYNLVGCRGQEGRLQTCSHKWVIRAVVHRTMGTLKAQLLVKINNALLPNKLDYQQYHIMFFVPKSGLVKPGLTLLTDDHYITLLAHVWASTNVILTVNITIQEKENIAEKKSVAIGAPGVETHENASEKQKNIHRLALVHIYVLKPFYRRRRNLLFFLEMWIVPQRSRSYKTHGSAWTISLRALVCTVISFQIPSYTYLWITNALSAGHQQWYVHTLSSTHSYSLIAQKWQFHNNWQAAESLALWFYCTNFANSPTTHEWPSKS